MDAFSTLTDTLAAAASEISERLQTRVTAALADAVHASGLLRPSHRVAGSRSYARHLLYSDPHGRFSVMTLVWQPGQASPVHGHYTWCAYAVLEGELEETLYEYHRGTKQATPLDVRSRKQGHTSFVYPGLDEVHRIRNAGTLPAISLHVYGVAWKRVRSDVNRSVSVAYA